MSLKHNEIYAKLMAPFKDQKTRKGTGGKSFTYITARQLANRLDDVLGPDAWFDTYLIHQGGVICKLTLVMPDGTEITKEDGSGGADMDDESDEFKSMLSGAFKRAGAKHGVARYCYKDGVPALAGAVFEGWHAAEPAEDNSSSGGGSGGGNGGGSSGYAPNYDCPKSGRALFAWMKDREAEFKWSVLDAINAHPEIKNKFPNRMTEWSDSQVAFGYALMKQMWVEAGKWPTGAGNSPGEVSNQGGQATSVPGTVAAPAEVAVDPEKLKEVKGKIRATYTALIEAAVPGVKVTYPVLMERVNAAVAARGWKPIDNMVAYRDMAVLRAILADGEAALTSADDIPF